MSRTNWPRLATIAGCAQLFTDAGHAIDRSNLSRWISNRKFAGHQQGKRLLYDPNALFDAWSSDFGRNLMAGKTGNAVLGLSQDGAQPPAAFDAHADAAGGARSSPSPAGPGSSERRSDPKFDIATLNARKLQREVAEAEGRTMSAEEVAATLAESLAELRAALSRQAALEAAKLLKDMNLPGHLQAVLVAGLKRYGNHAQEAWATAAAQLLDRSTPAGMAARERIEALVAFDLEIRNEQAGQLALAGD